MRCSDLWCTSLSLWPVSSATERSFGRFSAWRCRRLTAGLDRQSVAWSLKALGLPSNSTVARVLSIDRYTHGRVRSQADGLCLEDSRCNCRCKCMEISVEDQVETEPDERFSVSQPAKMRYESSLNVMEPPGHEENIHSTDRVCKTFYAIPCQKMYRMRGAICQPLRNTL